MSPPGLLVAYCLLIVAASLAGGWLTLRFRLSHKALQLALSLVAGVILGIGLLEMLPHAIEERTRAAAARGILNSNPAHDISHAVQPVLWWTLGGFLAMFLIERFFCFHQHESPAHDHGDQPATAHHERAAAPEPERELTWTGALVGLTLHSLVAGIALAASVLGHPDEATGLTVGLGTFLVVFLHKPFDSLTLGALMAVRGHSTRRRHVVNGLFALTVPAGAALLAFGAMGDEVFRHQVIGDALAFGAGAFLCIALSDLLPELKFHQHDRIKLSLALVLGLAVAAGVSRLESMAPGHGDASPSSAGVAGP